MAVHYLLEAIAKQIGHETNNKILYGIQKMGSDKTIAIPTYNRCNLLRQTQDSVLKQRVDGVEILVSDNASSDGTNEMMKEYSSKYEVRYFANPKNLRMDQNFLNCLQRAEGEYVHLLSDDDILLLGAVGKILDL